VRENGPVSPAPDAAQRDAAHQLDLTRRMREAEASILSRAPEHDLEPSLDRIRAVMELLGDPQRTFPVIHVTGTNGKTSTSRIIEALLRELGLNTGRFTSPHLHSMTERIAVGGQPIDAERFLAAYDEVIPFVEMVDARSIIDGGPAMTYFEVIVAVAYAAFADLPGRRRGRRGRHGWRLGRDERHRRAGQRRHADRAGPPALPRRHHRAHRDREGRDHQARRDHGHGRAARAGCRRRARCATRRPRSGARLVAEGVDIGVTARDVAFGGQQISVRGLAAEYEDLFLPLHGTHQAQNAAVAIAAVEAFLGGGEQPLDIDVLRAGLATAESPGGWRSCGAAPRCSSTPRTTLRVPRCWPGPSPSRSPSPASSGSSRDEGQGRPRRCSRSSSRCSTTSSSPARPPTGDDPRRLGELAAEVFGEQRVTVVEELPDALDVAAGMADADGGVSGGVLATGSVVTAAEVRMLLGTTAV
jgi:dihydrofolate synthase/folylpolyglutamate synthase